MARLFFVSGGSASGKSAYAEELAVRLWKEKRATGRKDAKMIYAATMRVYGEEGRAKVETHRKLREGKGFFTIEQPLDIDELEVGQGDTVLLEDLANLLANEMYEEAGSHENCVRHITEGIFSLCERGCDIVCVSCEVFSDGLSYEESTRRYLECLGHIHRILAKEAELVAELVCGIPLIYKNGQEKYDGTGNQVTGTDRIGRSVGGRSGKSGKKKAGCVGKAAGKPGHAGRSVRAAGGDHGKGKESGTGKSAADLCRR